MLINYFDNASTTKIDSRVREAMSPYLNDFVGNASSKVLTKIHLIKELDFQQLLTENLMILEIRLSSIKDYSRATRNFVLLNH